MLILGLDIATSTGVCWMETALPASKWRCLAITAEGDFQEDKTGDLSIYLNEEFFRTRPDFVAIEMPRRDVAAYPKQIRDPQTGRMKTIHTVNADQLLLPALASAAATACDLARIPWGLVHQKTWRAAYYGKGFRPQGDDWKAAAVDAAIQMGVVLPLEKKAQKDAAEAVGIAHAWMKCTQIPARHHDAFAKLRLGSAKVAA
jgi:hypothetical protein